jgi:glycosyltransferase involved in cell wall biosynthesis
MVAGKQNMRIGIITQQIPYGKGEAFVLVELEEYIRQHIDITVFPVRPEKQVFHNISNTLLNCTINSRLISFSNLFLLLIFVITQPKKMLTIFRILLKSRSFKIFIKNLIILPKAIQISEDVKRLRLEHLHAYWASTSATLAMIVSFLTGVSWSTTLYRWDITENNLLALKYSSALFFRHPDKQGILEVSQICKLIDNNKCHLIRSGVLIPKTANNISVNHSFSIRKVFRIGVPGMFVEKKGHKYIILALKELAKQIINIECWFIGDGPLRKKIEEMVNVEKINNSIVFKGIMRLHDLQQIYLDKKIDVVVLPSIITQNDEREGIPVSLIDAMACGIPVISTMTGGIPELLCDNAGILVPERDAQSLVSSIMQLVNSQELINQLSKNGRLRILEEYSVDSVIKAILSKITLVQNKF